MKKQELNFLLHSSAHLLLSHAVRSLTWYPRSRPINGDFAFPSVANSRTSHSPNSTPACLEYRQRGSVDDILESLYSSRRQPVLLSQVSLSYRTSRCGRGIT